MQGRSGALADVIEKIALAFAVPGRPYRRHRSGRTGTYIALVVHGNQTANVPAAYQRYLVNRFRSALRLRGTPLRIEFKTGENPYADRRNILTERQRKKRSRLMKHVRKRN